MGGGKRKCIEGVRCSGDAQPAHWYEGHHIGPGPRTPAHHHQHGYNIITSMVIAFNIVIAITIVTIIVIAIATITITITITTIIIIIIIMCYMRRQCNGAANFAPSGPWKAHPAKRDGNSLVNAVVHESVMERQVHFQSSD